MKKKLFFLFTIISISLFSEVSDVSFVLKGGYNILGRYTEADSFGEIGKLFSPEDNTKLTGSYHVKGEFHSRSRRFRGLFWGAGVGYMGGGSLDPSVGGSSKLGIDYFPLYLLMHLQFQSNYYYDWDMYFSNRLGISYVMDRGRLGDNEITEPLSTPTPYIGGAFGFERQNFIIEFFFDAVAGASVNKEVDLSDLDEFDIEDSIAFLALWNYRMGISIGYRFNSGWVY